MTKMLNFLNLIGSYSLLLRKKDLINKKLDLYRFIKSSEDYLEIYEEIINLEIVLRNNKKDMKYLNEDYNYLKKQRDKIKNEINKNNLIINSFNEQIKENKKKIQRITNSMDGKLDLEKEEMPKSERIQILQRQIRDFKFNIKQNISYLDEIQLQMDNITPKLETFKKNYDFLLNSIIKTREDISKHKSDLIIKLFDQIDDRLIEFEWLNTADELNENLVAVDSKLQRISTALNIPLNQNQLDLSTNKKIYLK